MLSFPKHNKSILNKKINRKKKFKKGTFELLLMSTPALLFLLILKYLPLYGLIIPFKDYKYNKGIIGSEWAGFKNFEFFFTSDNVWNVTSNTIFYNLALILVGTIFSVISALVLYEITSKTSIKVYQTILFIPYFLSWVVVSYMIYAFFNEPFGILNSLFDSLALHKVAWYAEPRYWPFILIAMGVWKGMGYSIIIYFSVLLSVDSAYFEAASIDGAGKIKSIWYISLPHLIPIVIILTLLAIGRIFYSDFGLFYFLPKQSGLLQPTTDVIDTYIFRALRKFGDFGMASAVNLYQSLMGLVLILVSNSVVRKVDSERAIF